MRVGWPPWGSQRGGWGEWVAHLASVTSRLIVIVLVEVEEGELHPGNVDRLAGVALHKLEHEGDFVGINVGFLATQVSVGSIHVDIAEGSPDFILHVMSSTIIRVLFIGKHPVDRLHDAHTGGQRHAVRASEAEARAGQARARRTQLG